MEEAATSHVRPGVAIEAVVFSAGNDFNGLEFFGCHCLVPLTNRPLLWYPVNILLQQQFSCVHFITAESTSVQIRSFLDLEFPTLKSVVHSIRGDGPNASDRGSLDILRGLSIEFNPSTEILILPCDLILLNNSVIKNALNEHWRRNAAVTVVLSRPDFSAGEEVQVPKPPTTQNSLLSDTAVMDSSNNRLLYLEGHGTISKDLNFCYQILGKFPSMTVLTKVRNTHFFVITGTAYNFLIEQQKWSNIYEAITQLIHNQHELPVTSPIFSGDIEDSPSGRQSKQHTSGLIGLTASQELSGIRQDFERRGCDFPKDVCFCCGFMVPEHELCVRANNVESYMYAAAKLLACGHKNDRRHPSVKLPPRTSVGNESYVGADTKIGERCKVKSSVMGSQCQLVERVKVMNSILMDSVSVEQGSVLINCIVGSGVSIGENVELKGCIIIPNTSISSETKSCGTILPEEASENGF